MARQALSTEQRLIRAAMLFLLLGLLLKALSMPLATVHWDSNYYLNIGSNFIERGELTPYMWRLGADTNIIAGSGTGYGVLILTYWFKVFGLSLYSGYALMYIVGVLSLVVLYFLARDWWQSRQAGIIAIVFTALSGAFIAQFYIRMDALGVLAYLLVLWLHLTAVRRQHNWLHFAVGVAIIVAVEVHIQTLLYIVAISFYYLLEYLRLLRRERRILLIRPSIFYFSGAFIAGVIYLFIHVFPDPEAYFIIARNCQNCTSAGIAKEIERYLIYIYGYSLDAFIFCLAIAIAWSRRSAPDKHFFTLLIGYLLGQAIISPPAQIHYITHMIPLVGIGVGGIFHTTQESENGITQRQLTMGLVGVSFLLVFQFISVLGNSETDNQAPDNVAYVQDYIASDTVVMGLPPLYHHLIEYDRFLSYRAGEQHGINLRDEDYMTFWEREQPQVFIGQAREDDNLWWEYMNIHDFQQVRADVWVAGDLLETLIIDNPMPEISFASTESSVLFGDCIVLEWSVLDADSITINRVSENSSGMKEICPNTTTDYTLSAYWVGGIETETITTEVD
ncbi:MAG: glycosyltransferase family 39 protein [Anaerolineae bacterium]|nr:glycosyltransferase family 39 protein [Anaerolineae bacterium]MDQ7035490.1 glycosyltransferase family 39 protein [Anaerolineae bacterium]